MHQTFYFIFLYSILIIWTSNNTSSSLLVSSQSYQVQQEQGRKTQVMKDCYISNHYPLYDSMVHLKGSGNNEKSDLTFHYKLSESDGTFTAHMEYRGLGYVSWGVSSDGMMVPGNSIIGLPDEPNSQANPGKYSMSWKALSGVTLMDNNNQNLINSIVTQDDTFTNLTFTKLLVEDDDGEEEFDISSTGPNYFVWAIGMFNNFAVHKSWASFVLDFSIDCIGSEELDTNEITLIDNIDREEDETNGVLDEHDGEEIADKEISVENSGYFRNCWLSVTIAGFFSLLLII